MMLRYGLQHPVLEGVFILCTDVSTVSCHEVMQSLGGNATVSEPFYFRWLLENDRVWGFQREALSGISGQLSKKECQSANRFSPLPFAVHFCVGIRYGLNTKTYPLSPLVPYPPVFKPYPRAHPENEEVATAPGFLKPQKRSHR
jgi:hypothetical protein